MKGSIKLFKIDDIWIKVHITFFLLLLIFLSIGFRWLLLIIAIFCFVTLHELAHSLVAKKFGVKVKEITLLPIGGVASMSKMPEKPSQEFLISLAGPMFNIAVVVIFFLPLYYMLTPEVLFGTLDYIVYHFFGSHIVSPGLYLVTEPPLIAHIYWINLVLAVFNLIPAFPMDGGRILRALLAERMNYRKATRIAVNFGHAFALLFGYFGFLRMNFWLVIIAVFIYMAASSEELQVDIKETLKKFTIKDIIPSQFLTLTKDTTLSKVLELIFHSHQEDFPVVEGGRMIGFLTRQDITNGIHQRGMSATVTNVMRKNFPILRESDGLDSAQNIMQENGMRALPVLKHGSVLGVVTLEDITRVYSVMAAKK